MKGFRLKTGYIAAGLAFLAAWAFFQFAYPYHLMRREEMDLFLYDWEYIRQTYRGFGWLARFASDFLDQFFHLSVVGPLVVAALLLAIGAAAYRICRHFLGKWPSLGIATLVYAWSFLRETENLYCTRYTLVVLGYLALVLLALRFKKAWMRPVAAVLLLALGAWTLGSPVHRYYGKAWGTPRVAYDRMIGLDVETARENWDKVLKLSERDLYITEASYCYNLAHAMKGDLSQSLFQHSQNHANGLLLRISTESSAFTNCLAGEAWYHLGDMTLPEQSAIIALQASLRHTGTRYLLRMARVNLISGQEATAQKYLALLSKTLFYGKWAKSMLPGHRDAAAEAWLEAARANLAHGDFVHNLRQSRDILLGLLEANPDNDLARNYLLCYDLLQYDLEHFMEVYASKPIDSPIYHQAALIWLSQEDRVTAEDAARYGASQEDIDRMARFFRHPAGYKNSYWYYYLKALNEQQ